MIEVRVDVENVLQVMTMVDDLRSQGLIQHQDFDFAYHPPPMDAFSVPIIERYVIFSFHTEKYATLFTLKYAK